jgi:hypothetical protein
VSSRPVDLGLTDAKLMLMTTQWLSLKEIKSKVQAVDQPLVESRLNALARLGLLRSRVAARGRQWRRSKLTWRASVIGQLGFVWVDGGPLYIRLLANKHIDNHRRDDRIERLKAGTFKTRAPRSNREKTLT